MVEKYISLLHRVGFLKRTSHKSKALCHAEWAPMVIKDQYKLQMIYPVANAKKGCHYYGKSTALWGAGHEYPIKGEDFSYLIWSKRDCCGFRT